MLNDIKETTLAPISLKFIKKLILKPIFHKVYYFLNPPLRFLYKDLHIGL
jgi:hypothetical protein